MIKKFSWIIFLLWPLGSHAALTGFLDNPALKICMETGNCQLSDISLALMLLVKLLLGGMGGVALIFFIYGGIEWLTSEGVPNRIAKGKEVMVNTIWALAIAFSSYLIVSFFINKIINVEPGLQITQQISECQGKQDNVPCGGDASNNYVCYQSKCLTKCDVKALMSNPSQNWQCYEVANSQSISDNPAYFVKNLCPGGVDNICTLLDAGGQPAIFDDPNFQAANQAIINCFINHSCAP